MFFSRMTGAVSMTRISKLKSFKLYKTDKDQNEILPVDIILQICDFLSLSLHSALESDQHLYQVLEWSNLLILSNKHSRTQSCRNGITDSTY